MSHWSLAQQFDHLKPHPMDSTSRVKKYLERVLGVLEDDFMIFVDNTISHKDNMCDFFDYLKSSEDLEWKETGIGDGLVVVKRKTWGLG